MSTHSASRTRASHPQYGWRHTLRCGLLALGLVFPAAAYPITLQQLLRMPLEQLLRLEISAPSALPILGNRTTTPLVFTGWRRV